MALERQMAPTLDEIDHSHVARYAWASQYVIAKKVLDAACGCGYGSYVLGLVAHSVLGADRSPEAIAYAMAHYQRANISFMEYDLNAEPLEFAGFQGIVSLETIEHLDRPVEETLKLFHGALCPGGVLCISHPINEAEKRANPNPFHKQFWIDDVKIKEAVTKMGFKLLESKWQPGCKVYDYHLMALRKA